MDELQSDHEAFIMLLLRHEPMVRAAIRAVVHRAEDVDEVMQAVHADPRLWIDSGDPDSRARHPLGHARAEFCCAMSERAVIEHRNIENIQ